MTITEMNFNVFLDYYILVKRPETTIKRTLRPLWTFTCPSLHEKDSGDWQEVRAAQQKLLSSLHRAGSETDRLDDGQLLSRALG